jgi:aldose 1-epimerase
VIELYRLDSGAGIAVEVLTHGASIHRVLVPRADGKPVNIALGFGTLDECVDNGDHYFGATVGRYAKRIAGGRFTLDGETYLLPLNDGESSLHGGLRSSDRPAIRRDNLPGS